MIANSFIFIVLLILLPDIIIYQHYFRRPGVSIWVKMLWWGQTILMLACTVLLATTRDFTPHPQTPLNIFLFVVGVYLIPKMLWSFSTSFGRLLQKRFHGKHNWGGIFGCGLALMSIYVTIYGSTIGFNKFEIRRVDYASADLPKGFDGYRIAVFSDAHVGNYEKDNRLLCSLVDSINALHPDVVFFLGDLQNTQPSEIAVHQSVLSQIEASDGVFSILGNHDYSCYIGGTREEKMASEKETIAMERQMGWRLLLNEHTMLYHGGDSIALAGIEGNEVIVADDKDHGRGIFEKAVEGIPEGMFTIMLMHNPEHWGIDILPNTNIQLSLSGHTHGGQISLFGLTPVMFNYPEYNGMYERDGQHLFVTVGVGAMIPLRFGVTGEVVLLTMHCQ